MKKNSKKDFKIPFYAHLLTQQEMLHASGAANTSPQTDQAQTAKAPSDQEDTNLIGDRVQHQDY